MKNCPQNKIKILSDKTLCLLYFVVSDYMK